MLAHVMEEEHFAIEAIAIHAQVAALASDIVQFKLLMPGVGAVAVDRLHISLPQPWIERRRREGKTPGTINHALKVVRRNLNLASAEWVDENRLTWLIVDVVAARTGAGAWGPGARPGGMPR